MVQLNLLPRVEFLEPVTCKCTCQLQSIEFFQHVRAFVPLSFTASEIWYGPSHLNASFHNMSFLRRVSCNKTILPTTSSSSPIVCLRSCCSFPSRRTRWRWRVAFSRSLSQCCNWRARIANRSAVEWTSLQEKIRQVAISSSIRRTGLLPRLM